MRPIDADTMKTDIKVSPWAAPEEIKRAELIKEWIDARPTIDICDVVSLDPVYPTPVHDVLAPSGIAYTCNRCGVTVIRRYNYCPVCGHKIDWSKVYGS